MKTIVISFILFAIPASIVYSDPSEIGPQPPSAGWNFGNVTYSQESGSLVLNSLSDRYGISQFQTANTNGQAMQMLGNNDYIQESAVKNQLAIDGYTQAYDLNPNYKGLYPSAYNQSLPTNIPLTELSFTGLAGDPTAIQNVYVPTAEYNALSAQGQAASISTLNMQTAVNTQNITALDIGLGDETQARIAGDAGLQSQIDATNNNVQALDNHVSNLERLKVMPEADIRFYDDKHVSAIVYDAYDATNRRNFAVGVKVMLKLGKSYEEQRIDELQKLVAELQTRKGK